LYLFFCFSRRLYFGERKKWVLVPILRSAFLILWPPTSPEKIGFIPHIKFCILDYCGHLQVRLSNREPSLDERDRETENLKNTSRQQKERFNSMPQSEMNTFCAVERGGGGVLNREPIYHGALIVGSTSAQQQCWATAVICQNQFQRRGSCLH
jgi:hypothetical protein